MSSLSAAGSMSAPSSVERHQVWWYLGAVMLGLAAGLLAPGVGPFVEVLVWPVLAVLLLVVFFLTPWSQLPGVLARPRFLLAALAGNAVVMPLIAVALVHLGPEDPVLRFGLLLVLVAPCTDWFMTFTHVSGGDTAAASALIPVNLMAQLVLIPVYLWLFAPEIPGSGEANPATGVVAGAAVLILGSMLLGATAAWWAQRRPALARVRARAEVAPVPLLAVVLFLVAASQAWIVLDAAGSLPGIAAVALGYLVLAVLVASVLARLTRVPREQGITLTMTLATRNSFVVLPVALALPAGAEVAAVAVVFQSLVELLGILVLLWVLPRWVFPRRVSSTASA